MPYDSNDYARGVSLILLVAETAPDLDRFFSDLFSRHAPGSIEFIVVGSASKAPLHKTLSKYATHAFIRCIAAPPNQSAPALKNLAAAKASCSYLFFAYPFASINPDSVKHLRMALHDADIGAVSMHSYPFARTCSHNAFDRYAGVQIAHNESMLLCRRSVFEQIGGFVESSVRDGDEHTDFCQRVEARLGKACLSIQAEGLSAKSGLNLKRGSEKQGRAAANPIVTSKETLGPALLWLFHGSGGGGGALSIVQEACCIQNMGWTSKVAANLAYKEKVMKTYSHLSEDVFLFYADENELLEKAKWFDVGVATHFLTMDTLVCLCQAWPNLIPAYYIQDYEPWILQQQSKNYDHLLKKARESYTRLPGILCFAKTEWLRQTVQHFHQIEVEKVEPGLDTDVFPPAESAIRRDTSSRIQITAMIRPQTPRRSPRNTMQVLQKIKKGHPDKARVVVFGCPADEPEILDWQQHFAFEVKGVLTAAEVSRLLTDSDVFLDMSVYQAFGRTGLEAMARGCAVVLPLHGGVHEYAVHRQNCLLVDTNDLRVCEEAVAELINNSSVRISLAEQGVETAGQYSVQSAALSEMPLFVKAQLRSKPNTQAAITINSSDEDRSRSREQVRQLTYRLKELGFTERALADLHGLAADASYPVRQQLAAWELALWHADQYTEPDAGQCLELLERVIHQGSDSPSRWQAAVLQAECYGLLGDREKGEQVIQEAFVPYAPAINQSWSAAPAGRLDARTGTEVEASNQDKTAAANLLLAAANLQTSLSDRVDTVNQVLGLFGLAPIFCDPDRAAAAYDCLQPGSSDRKRVHERQPGRSSCKVSVIVPVYNAEETIQTALDSILHQTWKNLEVLVVDDCSTDDTVKVVQGYAQHDSRVRLLRTKSNQGPYVARNVALQQAGGEFVTCHDADDWSHPQKIAVQASRLLQNEEVIANVSSWARVSNNMRFYRRGNPGYYLQLNISSLLFRREPVRRKLGHWDSVRFGADTEFYFRLKKVFGTKAIEEIAMSLLSFSRTTRHCLTEDATCGYPGFLMGARKEYKEGYMGFHAAAGRLCYEFPMQVRPFAVPDIMKPNRSIRRDPGLTEDGSLQARHFRGIYVADFSQPDNAKFLVHELQKIPLQDTTCPAQETMAYEASNAAIGLIQMHRYERDVNSSRSMHKKVRNFVNQGQAQMLVYGEEAACDELIILDPLVLQDRQRYVPAIQAAEIKVVMTQGRNFSTGSSAAGLDCDVKRCDRHLQDCFGKKGTWYPLNGAVRQRVQNCLRLELECINMSGQNWKG